MAQISGCSRTVTQLNQISGCTQFDSSFLLLIVDTINGETKSIPVSTMFSCMGDDNFYLTGGTYSNGYINFSGNGTNFSVDVNALLDDTNTYLTGSTLSGNTLILNQNNGTNIYTDLSQYDFTYDLLDLNDKIDNHTGNTNNPHQTSFYNLTTTAHTHSIEDITNHFDLYLSAGTYSNGYINFSGHGINFSVDVNALLDDTNTYLTGSTLSGNTLILNQNNGTNIYTDLSILTFTGNTSGNCFSQLYVSNIYGCSPVTIHTSVQQGSGCVATGEYSFAQGLLVQAIGNYSHAEGLNARSSGYTAHAEGLNTIALGESSHAEGCQTQAISNYSHAEGYETKANGSSSHSEGLYTQANGYASHAQGSYTLASGQNSHAEGDKTIASGYASHAEGSGTTASGLYSHSEGFGTIANGLYSHSEGYLTTASGFYSHAEGYGTIANGTISHAEGQGTIASGYASHAEGSGTISSAQQSHAEGYQTQANGTISHAEGDRTITSGYASHAEGYQTQANGYSTHAQGYRTTANDYCEFVGGHYNIVGTGSSDYWIPTDNLFTLGNGTTGGTRSNAFQIKKNGTIIITQPLSATTNDVLCVESNGTITKKTITPTTAGVWELGSGLLSVQTVGTGCNASGDYSVAEGGLTIASGYYSHAEGYSTLASGVQSHAEGYSTLASGLASHAEGGLTIASGDYSHAEGYSTLASGLQSHAEGYNTLANGTQSHAEGQYTTTNGEISHAQGFQTTANDYCEHVGGRYNIVSSGDSLNWVTTDNLFTLGNGEPGVARSNAFQVKKNGQVIAGSSVQVGTDSTGASTTNVGAIRYRSDANNSYCEMVMQTGASTYAWVVIKTNNW